jgi:hypothetical protein
MTVDEALLRISDNLKHSIRCFTSGDTVGGKAFVERALHYWKHYVKQSGVMAVYPSGKPVTAKGPAGNTPKPGTVPRTPSTRVNVSPPFEPPPAPHSAPPARAPNVAPIQETLKIPGQSPLPNNPVDIEAHRMKSLRLMALDPLTILQLRAMLMDLAVYKLGTPEIRQEYEMEKEYEKYWFWKYMNDGNTDSIKDYNRWRRDCEA